MQKMQKLSFKDIQRSIVYSGQKKKRFNLQVQEQETSLLNYNRFLQ